MSRPSVDRVNPPQLSSSKEDQLSPVEALLHQLPPFSQRRNPTIAAVMGFALGGIGLAIYLRSFIDFIVPLLLGVVMIHFVGDVGWLAGAALASAWGYARVTVSNQALDSTTPRQRHLP
jgi:hypothetical protein